MLPTHTDGARSLPPLAAATAAFRKQSLHLQHTCTKLSCVQVQNLLVAIDCGCRFDPAGNGNASTPEELDDVMHQIGSDKQRYESMLAWKHTPVRSLRCYLRTLCQRSCHAHVTHPPVHTCHVQCMCIQRHWKSAELAS